MDCKPKSATDRSFLTLRNGIAIQPYVFFDGMAVWNKNIRGDPQKIYSAGGGFRATIGRQANLDMTDCGAAEKGCISNPPRQRKGADNADRPTCTVEAMNNDERTPILR